MAKFIKITAHNVVNSSVVNNCTELLNIDFIKTVTFVIANSKSSAQGSAQQFTQLAHFELTDNTKRILKLTPAEFEKILRRLNTNESDIEDVEAGETDSNPSTGSCKDQPFV